MPLEVFEKGRVGELDAGCRRGQQSQRRALLFLVRKHEGGGGVEPDLNVAAGPPQDVGAGAEDRAHAAQPARPAVGTPGSVHRARAHQRPPRRGGPAGRVRWVLAVGAARRSSDAGRWAPTVGRWPPPAGRSPLGSGLPEDAVQVRATDRAHGLRHARALVVYLDLTLRLALLLALHAVELAAPGLRHDGLLAVSRTGRRRGSRTTRRGRLDAAASAHYGRRESDTRTRGRFVRHPLWSP